MSNEGVVLGSQGGVGTTSEVEGSLEEKVNTLTNQVGALTDLLTKLVSQGGGEARVLGDSAPEVEERLGQPSIEEGLPTSRHGIRATPPPPSLREEEVRRQIHRGGGRSDVGGARSDARGDGSDESDADLVSRSSTSSMRMVRARAMGVKPDSLKVSKFDGTHCWQTVSFALCFFLLRFVWCGVFVHVGVVRTRW